MTSKNINVGFHGNEHSNVCVCVCVCVCVIGSVAIVTLKK